MLPLSFTTSSGQPKYGQSAAWCCCWHTQYLNAKRLASEACGHVMTRSFDHILALLASRDDEDPMRAIGIEPQGAE